MNLIQRAKASLNARIIQPNMQKHFEKTSYGEKLAGSNQTDRKQNLYFGNA